MARTPRPDLAEVPQHIVQRGNNRGTCFFEDGHRLFYLGLLAEACRVHDVAIHAYVLMTNHVHLLATPHRAGGVSMVMQAIGRRYVQWVNKRLNRTGGLYDGRFKAELVDSDRYLMCCYRYIELNPVRAGLAPGPAAYRWSSYRCNALGEPDSLVTPHPVFEDLGAALDERRERYREFVAEGVTDEERETIRARLNPGRGRPRKQQEKKGSDHFSKNDLTLF
jgi:putative transposase